MRWLAITWSVLLLGAAPAAAQGLAAGEFLRFPLGARTASMGGAATGLGGEALAVSLNPAAAAFLRRSEAGLERYDLFEDLTFHDGALMTPLGRRGTLGISARLLDYGRIDFATTQALGGLGSFSASDAAAAVTYAHRLWSDWAIGGAFKVVRSDLAGFTADAVAVDLGARYEAPWGLSAGLAVLHIGSGLKYLAVEEDLPIEFRAGLAYRGWNALGIGRLSGAIDLAVARGEVTGQAGGELEIYDRLALRLGWDGSNDAGTGITAGLGLLWDDLALDYAYLPYGDLGGTHRLSGRYRFGRERPEEVAEAPLLRGEARPVEYAPPPPPVAPPPRPAPAARAGVFLERAEDPALRPAWAATFIALAGAPDLVPAPADRAEVRLSLLVAANGTAARIRDDRGNLIDFYIDTSGDPRAFAEGLVERVRQALGRMRIE